MSSPIIWGGTGGIGKLLPTTSPGYIQTDNVGNLSTVNGTPQQPVATATPSSASTTTISSLNGDNDKEWKIKIVGTWSGADAIIMGMRPNNDSTAGNYRGVRYFYYSSGIVSAVTATDIIEVARKGYAGDNSVDIELFMGCSARSVGRPWQSQVAWFTPSSNDGGTQFNGGGWNDTTNNITSLVFDFGSGGTFTGSIYIYQYSLGGGSGPGITRSINSISSPTTAGATAATDYVYLVSGTTTLTLPTAVGNTNLYTIKNTGSNTVTVATTSSQTIDGSTTASLPTQYDSIAVVSNNSNWSIV